jgi:hypothetical protein
VRGTAGGGRRAVSHAGRGLLRGVTHVRLEEGVPAREGGAGASESVSESVSRKASVCACVSQAVR